VRRFSGAPCPLFAWWCVDALVEINEAGTLEVIRRSSRSKPPNSIAGPKGRSIPSPARFAGHDDEMALQTAAIGESDL